MAGDMPAPCSLDIELRYLELVRDLAAIVSNTPSHKHIAMGEARALLERHTPAPRKADKPVAPPPAPKPPKVVKPLPKHRYRRKTYDQPYTPWPEPEHPVTSGLRTSFGSIKSG